MHVIFQKIRTSIPAMSIKNCKIAAFRPSTFIIRLSYIHYYGDTIFIVIFNHSMESINRITFDNSIAFFYEFNWLDFGDS